MVSVREEIDATIPFSIAIHHIPAQLMLHELDRRLLDEVIFGVGGHGVAFCV